MPHQTEEMSIRPEIPAVLTQLRGRIRGYVFWEGLAKVMFILSLFFWVSLAVDYGCSVWFHTELARPVRIALAVAAAGWAGVALISSVVGRMMREFHVEALALVLERRFPQLNDRLITSVQLADRSGGNPGLTGDLLRRTVDEVADLSGDLALGEVFDFRPLKKAIATATLMALLIAGFAVLYPGTTETWYRRNVIFADEYWPRESELELIVLAAPGERVRHFDETGRYKHPRGGDLTLLARVGEGSTPPEQVRLNYRFLNRSGGSSGYFSKLGTDEFKITVKGFQQSARLTVTGGDFYNRRPFIIEVVDPPEVDSIRLDCLYPAYTRLNEVNDDQTEFVRTPVTVQGSQVTLPVGTDFLLRADSSKPLTAARIQTARFTIDVNGDVATLTIPSADQHPDRVIAIPQELSESIFDATGRRLTLPMILTGHEAPPLLAEANQVSWPVPLPAEAALQIDLTDQDGVVTQQPSRLTISGIVDESPVVTTRPRGVRNSITRRAVIPIEGEITDDYGVAEARFEYQLDGDSEYRQHPFRQPADLEREVVVDERFEVLNLDLALGQKLTLSVLAVDADNLHGPHEKRGEATVFQIVSPEELLSLISARELNLRQRFEQILQEVEAIRADLSSHRVKLREVEPWRKAAPPSESIEEIRRQLRELDISVRTIAQRSLLKIRKNANETASIEEAFIDIRAELINNGVQTPRMLDRLEQGILKPLNQLNTLHYNNVDESLGLLKLALEQESAPTPFQSLDVCIEELDQTIAQIQRVLAAMLKLETINEVRELLRSILEQQQDLKKKTEQERKQRLIDDL